MSVLPAASPAERCQLRVDDEIVAVDGVSVAHLTSSQWKNKMASSLQSGSLTMDIRRYGVKGKYLPPKMIELVYPAFLTVRTTLSFTCL